MSRRKPPPLTPVVSRPAASPVNRFSTPVREELPASQVGPTSGQQLAEALRGFVPAAQRFALNRQTEQDQAAIAEANAARLKVGMSWAEAVRSGKISPDQNPFYIQAWKEQDGRVTANEYNTALLTRANEIANSTSHAESQEWVDAFRREFMQEKGILEQDTAFSEGFGRTALAHEDNFIRAQASRVSGNIQNEVRTNSVLEMEQSLAELRDREIGISGAADALNIQKERLRLVGVAPEEANDMILAAVALEAEQNLDVNILKVLDEIETGSGFLAGTSRAQEVILRTQERIQNKLDENDRTAAARAKAERDLRAQQASAVIEEAIFRAQSDGGVVHLADHESEMGILWENDPALARTMRNAINASHEEVVRVDTEAVAQQLWDDVFRGVSKRGDIYDAFSARDLTQQTVRLMLNEIESQEDRERQGQDREASVHPLFAKSLTNLERLFGQDPLGSYSPELEVLRHEAVMQFQLAAFRWRDSNPDSINDYEVVAQKASSLFEFVAAAYQPELDALKIKRINEPPGAPTRVSQQIFPDRDTWTSALSEYLSTAPEAQGDTELGRIMDQNGIQDPLTFIEEQSSHFAR